MIIGSQDAAMMIKSIWVPSLVTVGTILNLLTIMVFCRRRMRKYCLSVSMVSLAVADTAVLLIPVLLTWIDEQFFSFHYLNNTIWCNLHGYVDLVSCANSSWIIILISTERWFAVCRPWHKNSIFTSRMVARTIISIFFASVILFAYFPLSLRLDLAKAECKIAHEQMYFIFGTLSVILVYVLPFVVLAFLNVMIIIRLRQRPFQGASSSNGGAKKMSSAIASTIRMNRSGSRTASFVQIETTGGSGSPTRPQFLNSSNNTTNNQQEHTETSSPPRQAAIPTSTSHHHSSKNDRNLSITLVTLAITFMIFTFPFQVHWFYVNIYSTFSYSASSSTTSSSTSKNESLNETFEEEDSLVSSSSGGGGSENVFTMGDVTFMIKNMNYLINFFLYSLLSKLFRQELLAMIGGGGRVGSKPNCLGRFIKWTTLGRRRGDEPSSSSFAELSFSVEAFKSLKKGQYRTTRRKLFFFKIEPANFLEYFRHIGGRHSDSLRMSHHRKHPKNGLTTLNDVTIGDLCNGADDPSNISSGGVACAAAAPGEENNLLELEKQLLNLADKQDKIEISGDDGGDLAQNIGNDDFRHVVVELRKIDDDDEEEDENENVKKRIGDESAKNLSIRPKKVVRKSKTCSAIDDKSNITTKPAVQLISTSNSKPVIVCVEHDRSKPVANL